MSAQAETRAILERLSETEADLTVKGKTTPYLAVNGNMFAFVDRDGALCLRFDEATRAALAEDFATGPVLQYGAVMRGYVAIPAVVIGDPGRLGALFADCVEHARRLKPKPTKR